MVRKWSTGPISLSYTTRPTWKKAATSGSASALEAVGVAAGDRIHSSSGKPGSKLSTSTEADGGGNRLYKPIAELIDN
jgi:hypothetical protein